MSVQGEFSNRAGIVTLKYTVSCTLDAVCDRCLAELRRDYSYDFSHTVVPSLQSEGDIYDTYLVAQHDSIDMNETAISDLLLMLPTKMLCREDCKGLCDICGGNLNETTCDCRKLDAPAMSTCSNCGAFKAPHKVCKNCGFYKGVAVLKMDDAE